MKLYKVNKFVENYYRHSIDGNEDISTDLMRRKLTRNIHLAKELTPITKIIKIYQYGNLLIVTRWGRVIWLHNLRGNVYFTVDQFQRRKLNQILQIEDDKQEQDWGW